MFARSADRPGRPPRPARRAPALGAALAGDARGVAAVEFGMILLPFVALLCALFQITLTYFVQQVLETASDRAVRQLLTGAAQQSSMTKDQFVNAVCAKLPSFMKCANVLIDVRVSSSFSIADTRRPTPPVDATGKVVDNGVFTPGRAGEITVAKVMYVWDVQTGPLGFDISTMSKSRRLLTATSVFKTEPYQ